MKALADMADLEMDIRENSTTVIENRKPGSSELSFQVGAFVVGVFTDGFYSGEIINVETEHITADVLQPISLKQDYSQSSLWKKSPESSKDQHRLEISLLLPIRPVLGLNKFSSGRIVIYDLLNVDLIEKFL